ncbi:MAG: cytochrome P450 [Lysobacterales bacterium]
MGSKTADIDLLEMIQSFDPRFLGPGFYDDPFPLYAALREHSPIHELPDGGLFLTRYEDLRTVYKDPSTFSSDKTAAFLPVFGDSLLYQHHTSSLVFNDPPLHTRVRHLIQGALTPRAIAHMEQGLTELVDRLLDNVQPGKPFNAIDDFAAAIPIEIIGNLMNIPADERGPLREWSLAILSALEPQPTEAMKSAGNAAVAQFLDYLKGLVADRRKRPLDSTIDVLTKLIEGTGVTNGLTETELLQNCIFILNAGHETTTNLIGNGIELLLRNPDQRSRLVSHPEYLVTMVEEVLRMESSNQLGNRVCTHETRLGGVSIAQGTQLTLCIGAANRDPKRFDQPDVFDVARTPNHHLAFASGPHVCAGVNLARLEGKTALGRFTDRFPEAELAEPPVRGQRARFRGFTRLMIR